MKSVSRKRVLFGTMALAGMLAQLVDFSSLSHRRHVRPYEPVSFSDQTYRFQVTLPEGDLSRLLPRKIVIIDHGLTKLQEGIYGNTLAEYLKLRSRQYVATR